LVIDTYYIIRNISIIIGYNIIIIIIILQ